jgi:hypothetical protein
MGRKCKLTPDVQQRIVDCLVLGASRAAAAAAAGIGESTLYRWLDDGEAAGGGPFWEFREAVKGAEHRAELSALRHWHGAMPKDWRACAEFLRRRFPRRWGLRQGGVADSEQQRVIVVQENQMSVEEWHEMVQKLDTNTRPSAD